MASADAIPRTRSPGMVPNPGAKAPTPVAAAATITAMDFAMSASAKIILSRKKYPFRPRRIHSEGEQQSTTHAPSRYPNPAGPAREAELL
jgi:hypothetical protein